MAILTKFLQLLKPERNDYVDVEKHLSENYDKIDTKMEELSNSNDKKLDKGAVSSEYDTAKKIEDKIKTKLNQGNVPDVLNSAEKIIKALQGNTGIKFDENLLYLNDSGTKKKGYCYIDKLTDGIFECIQETTTTVNNATYFKNFSNKENSDRLSNLVKKSSFSTTYTKNEGKDYISLRDTQINFTKIGNIVIATLLTFITKTQSGTIEFKTLIKPNRTDSDFFPTTAVTGFAVGSYYPSAVETTINNDGSIYLNHGIKESFEENWFTGVFIYSID